jgi:pyrroline-5-carboxylate reductase
MRICIIGTGKMGGALARGIARSGGNELTLFDHSLEKSASIAREIGCKTAKSAKEAAQFSDAVVVAVKPGSVDALLSELGGSLSGKLLISIAAGTSLSHIESLVPKSCRVVAAMPNIAVEFGSGMSCYCLGFRATRDDAKAVEAIFSGNGGAIGLQGERMMDSAYISSSGIAFFFHAIDAMARAGEKNGLPRAVALRLAAAAASGAGAMAEKSGKQPAELEETVATKKGVTEQGLSVLRSRKTGEAFEEAALACIRKGREMREAHGQK